MEKVHLRMTDEDKEKYNSISEKLERILDTADKQVKKELKGTDFESTATLTKYWGTALFIAEITYTFTQETHITYTLLIGDDVSLGRCARDISFMAIRYFDRSVAPFNTQE